METRTATNRIVIHHSASPANTTMGQVDQWHRNQGFSCIGYHYFIESTGMIREGRDIWAVGAHAIGANNDSVGICLAGNFEEAPPTPEQIAALAVTIRDVRRLYGDIPYIGHKDVDPANHPTACPGALFPWDDLAKEFEEVKPMAEKWKVQIMQDAKDAGLISGEHDADETASKWFVLAVALKLLRLLKQ